ncbi:nucleotidyl transferase AbiEii/AbiGii toxin family protein [Opitutaceae bacterium TAV4]|nr:nucleotidyl transferase AbiEii/AbiGii toxin family protein [Opitutaceae bacterium TAV4]RRK00176.1 nucleotidyl transferase AbiEii/AbiGii toxin family protein [Opitutaceae bacterium TAV3]
MKTFASLPNDERRSVFLAASEQLGLPAVIVEKDFWVCWLLGHIFATPELGDHCVFKGGTSLSKVFEVIFRFSEDIDLGLSPASLGWNEAELDEAPSNTARAKRVKKIEADCAQAVRERWQTQLETIAQSILGRPATGNAWLVYTDDDPSHSPILRFYYPGVTPAGTGYIERAVKIEFGSLTDQRPIGKHPISPLIASLAPDAFADFRTEVVALEIERTFWEKATILHAEYHRPAGQPMKDRYARHYADFAALWLHPAGRAAANRLDLLERVRLHKSRFFASSWSNYATAAPGSFRLLPPDSRLPELRRDYVAMEPMFLKTPLGFDELIATLREAENILNGR